MSIATENFGELPGGEEAHWFTLSNNHGLSLKAISYGGIITELHVPDRQGQSNDVVLGLKRSSYSDTHFFRLTRCKPKSPGSGLITELILREIVQQSFSIGKLKVMLVGHCT